MEQAESVAQLDMRDRVLAVNHLSKLLVLDNQTLCWAPSSLRRRMVRLALSPPDVGPELSYI